jgi:hypothetical protein
MHPTTAGGMLQASISSGSSSSSSGQQQRAATQPAAGWQHSVWMTSNIKQQEALLMQLEMASEVYLQPASITRLCTCTHASTAVACPCTYVLHPCTQARETGICPVREELYAQCFDELIRQVTINCAERGLLLLRVRDEMRMTVAAYQVSSGPCGSPFVFLRHAMRVC